MIRLPGYVMVVAERLGWNDYARPKPAAAALKMSMPSVACLLVLLMGTATGAMAQQGLPAQLTLSEALTMALTNNSTLRTAQSRLEQASGEYMQSRSALLPQVEVRAHQALLTINLQGLGIHIPQVPEGTTDPFGSMDARAI